MLEKLSKLLTAALRHKPWDFGLELSPEGFIDLERVASSRAFRKHGASPRMLAKVCIQRQKQRFIFKRDGQHISIAASYGLLGHRGLHGCMLHFWVFVGEEKINSGNDLG